MFFKKKKKENITISESPEEKSGTTQIEKPENVIKNNSFKKKSETIRIEKPRICLFDIDEDITERIKQKGFNVTPASLGTLENIEYKNERDVKLCLLKHSIPPNLHEYDIVVVDMEAKPGIPHDEISSLNEFNKKPEALGFYCKFPKSVFDPRPYSAFKLSQSLSLLKKSILIAFASKFETQNYEFKEKTNSGLENKSMPLANYSFIRNSYEISNRNGEVFEVLKSWPELNNLLEKNRSKFHYQAFFKQYKYIDSYGQEIDFGNFTPLIKNNIDEIVSFSDKLDNDNLLLVFPQLKEKDEILIPLFENILPDIVPEVFPYSTKFSWKNHEDYWLPNSRSLFEKKAVLEAEYEKKKGELDKEIEENKKQYLFLHEIIMETDAKLVLAVKTYFEWLGFEKVKIMDEYKSGVFEEDLQVELDKGLLVIEVKGIGGPSTDNDCNQISKIRNRRAKEHKDIDVFALYIVNHQRYKRPKNRANPPFNEHQIEDAIDDKRGLLTTWELFKLYNYVKEEIISKSDAREAILKYGLVTFAPSNATPLGEVNEICYDDYVIILPLKNCRLKTGDKLIFSCGDMYKTAIIENLKVNGQDVDEACDGEVGIKLNIPVRKKSKIYLKTGSQEK